MTTWQRKVVMVLVFALVVAVASLAGHEDGARKGHGDQPMVPATCPGCEPTIYQEEP